MREMTAETFENRPWLANKQWAAGRIKDSSVPNLVLLWIFTLIWNAIAWALGFAVLGRIGHPSGLQWLAVGSFPFVGLIALMIAIYGTVRFLKFGRSYLELETIPGSIGGWLAGTIQTSANFRDAPFIRLTLRCVNRITRGSGKNASTHESTIWEAEQALKGTSLAADRTGGGAVIPVAFRIPGNCQATRDRYRDDIIWRLHARAAMPGADYAADFIVPVFEDESQPDDLVPKAQAQVVKLRASRAEVVAVDDPQIDISANAAGRTKFVFPASRNRTTAIVLTILTLLFGAVAVILLNLNSPVFFTVIFAAIAAALAYGAILYGLRHIELEVDRHGVRRAWRMLAFSGERSLRAIDIRGLEQTKTAEVNSTPYFTIYAQTNDGGKIALISGLRSADVEHVIGEIRNALGSAPAAARS
jgi:hypothetical protein